MRVRLAAGKGRDDIVGGAGGGAAGGELMAESVEALNDLLAAGFVGEPADGVGGDLVGAVAPGRKLGEK